MRKKKNPFAKAKTLSITVPPSYHAFMLEYHPGDFSSRVQEMIASEILGFDLDWFKAYASKYPDIRYRKDNLRQEFLRLARWITESKIQYLDAKTCAPDILVSVRWNLTEVSNIVRISPNFDMFHRVCYDTVYEKTMLPNEPSKEYFEMDNTFKFRVLIRWLELSGFSCATWHKLHGGV